MCSTRRARQTLVEAVETAARMDPHPTRPGSPAAPAGEAVGADKSVREFQQSGPRCRLPVLPYVNSSAAARLEAGVLAWISVWRTALDHCCALPDWSHERGIAQTAV
jgi:hypothetical protein